MIIKLDLIFDPLAALRFNITNLPETVALALINKLDDDETFIANLYELAEREDVTLSDDVVSFMQNMDIDDLPHFMTIHESSLDFDYFEAEDYLVYTIDVDLDIRQICKASIGTY